MGTEDNVLKYYRFYLPDYRIPNVDLYVDEAIDSFELSSLTATQGGFVSGGYLFQTFSFHSSTNLLRAPKMRVVDLNKHEVVKQYDDLGKEFGHYDEFENIAICSDGKIYGHGQKEFKIYEFSYTAE